MTWPAESDSQGRRVQQLMGQEDLQVSLMQIEVQEYCLILYLGLGETDGNS